MEVTPAIIAAIGIVLVNLVVAISTLLQSLRNGRSAKESAAVAQRTMTVAETTADVVAGTASKQNETHEQLAVIHTNTNGSLDKLNQRLDAAMEESRAERNENKAVVAALQAHLATQAAQVPAEPAEPAAPAVAAPARRRERRHP